MPYDTVWRKPRKFLTRKGVDIYCTYKDDEWSNGENEYHFSTRVDGVQADDSDEFDVRDLATFKEPKHPPFLCGANDTPYNRAAWNAYHASGCMEAAVKKAIRDAIDAGLIKPLKD